MHTFERIESILWGTYGTFGRRALLDKVRPWGQALGFCSLTLLYALSASCA